MSTPSTTTIIFFWVQGHDRVATFPDSFGGRESTESNTVSERPHADQLVQLPLTRCNSRGHHIRIIEDADGHFGQALAECIAQFCLQSEALDLLQVRRLLDNTHADDARKTYADSIDLMTLCSCVDLRTDLLDDALRWHRLQRVECSFILRKDPQLSLHPVTRDKAGCNVIHHQYAYCFPHSCACQSSPASEREECPTAAYVLAILFNPLNAAAL